MKKLKGLKLGEISRDLVKDMYIFAEHLPDGEKSGLASKIKHASISIPANITKGMSSFSAEDSVKFIDIANESSFQLELSLHMAFDLGYCSKKQLTHSLLKIIEVQHGLYGLRTQICKN